MPEDAISFPWFWAFWHWSADGFRRGELSRSPLQAIASNWEEWFQHVASEADQRAISLVSANANAQAQFVQWVCAQWSKEFDPTRNETAATFVLTQLSRLRPFIAWESVVRYRELHKLEGVSAVILGDANSGQPGDVRAMAGVLLPSFSEAEAGPIVNDGFELSKADLVTAKQAALSLLRGTSLGWFLAWWSLAGKRSYSRWTKAALALGWLAAAGVVLELLYGPEPSRTKLTVLAASLLGLWTVLALTAVIQVSRHVIAAKRVGQEWAKLLQSGVLWLRMEGGLVLQGKSAGLPVCLNALLSVITAYTARAKPSWLWTQVTLLCNRRVSSWCATGAVSARGLISPVALSNKIQACEKNPRIAHLLVPLQRGDAPHPKRASDVRRLGARLPRISGLLKTPRFGYAADVLKLKLHRVPHTAAALMAIGSLFSAKQLGLNVLALAVSAAVLAGAGDLLAILRPPGVPLLTPPSSPSPHYVWVSLQTKHPEYYHVVFESRVWNNRRAPVSFQRAITASARAEFRLVRRDWRENKLDEGTLWIERSPCFLHRRYILSERIARYPLSYINTLGHE